MSAQIARVRREHTRWYLIASLDKARPVGAYAELLLAIVQSVYSDMSMLELKREIDYLKDRQLVSVEIDPTDRWHCELTRAGVDVAEYTVDVEPGIARPRYGA